MIIPYAYMKSSSGSSGYTPPQTDLIGDWNPIQSKVLNSAGTGVPTDGSAMSSITDSSSNADTATQVSSGAMPIWYASDASRNNKPYIRFNENRTGTINGGVTFLEIQNQFDYDSSQLTIYMVMDIVHWDSIYDGYTDYFTNSEDHDWDGGFSIHSEQAVDTYSVAASVAQWPANELTINLSMSSPRVVIYKFFTAGLPAAYENKGGYSTGGTVSYTTDTSYADFANSRQSLSGFPYPLIGTGRDALGSEPYGGIDFKLFRLLVYETYHTDAESLTITNALKSEYNTL